MKKYIFFGTSIVLLVLLAFTGCSDAERPINDALMLRSQINESKEVCFRCRITADYGDSLCEFNMMCESEHNRSFRWEITAPETIAGISGSIINDKGQFEFDGDILVFELLADQMITPLASPWVLMKALQSGYIRSCGVDGENTVLQIDDSFSGLQFSTCIWLDSERRPIHGEILWQGRRIMSIEISDFVIM